MGRNACCAAHSSYLGTIPVTAGHPVHPSQDCTLLDCVDWYICTNGLTAAPFLIVVYVRTATTLYLTHIKESYVNIDTPFKSRRTNQRVSQSITGKRTIFISLRSIYLVNHTATATTTNCHVTEVA